MNLNKRECFDGIISLCYCLEYMNCSNSMTAGIPDLDDKHSVSRKVGAWNKSESRSSKKIIVKKKMKLSVK
jgi:hypothetical protein